MAEQSAPQYDNATTQQIATMTDQTFQPRQMTAPRAQAQSALTPARVTAPVLTVIFMITLIFPVSLDIAGFRMSPVRLFLLIMIIPTAVQLMVGRVGKLHFVDIFMLLFACWLMITLMYHEGMAKLAYSAVSVAELLGGYLIGRTFIRSATDFKFLIKCQLGVMLFLFPFAIIDFFTDNEIWANFLNQFGTATFRATSSYPRLGFQRVTTGFDHAILYGVFCSIATANVFYIWRNNIIAMLGRLGFVVGMTFMSLSSGALLSVVFQSCLIAWDIVTKSKWWLLLILSILAYIFISLASNRGPIILMIETMTFSAGTGWTRIIQWEYGSAEVLRNPIMGKGLDGDWVRPSWLYTSSIDNYWLVVAFRHGLPGIILLGAAFIGGFIYVIRAKNLSAEAAQIRTGYLIAFTGVCFSLASVHIWNAVAVYIYCYLGAGLWLTTQAAQSETDTLPPEPQRLSRYGNATEPVSAEITPDTGAQTPYSRFPIRPTKRTNK